MISSKRLWLPAGDQDSEPGFDAVPCCSEDSSKWIYHYTLPRDIASKAPGGASSSGSASGSSSDSPSALPPSATVSFAGALQDTSHSTTGEPADDSSNEGSPPSHAPIPLPTSATASSPSIAVQGSQTSDSEPPVPTALPVVSPT